MSIIFWIYEPLRLSRAIDLGTASAVSSSLYGPRRLHAHMSTQMRYAQYALGTALLFVRGGLALDLWLTVCVRVSKLVQKVKCAAFGHQWWLIIVPQRLWTQRNSVEARGPQLSAAKLWPSRNVIFFIEHIFWPSPFLLTICQYRLLSSSISNFNVVLMQFLEILKFPYHNFCSNSNPF